MSVRFFDTWAFTEQASWMVGLTPVGLRLWTWLFCGISGGQEELMVIFAVV